MDPASGNVQPAARGPRKGFPRGCWQDGKGEQPWLTWVIYGKKYMRIYVWKIVEISQNYVGLHIYIYI